MYLTLVLVQYAGTAPWDRRWWPGVSVQISAEALGHLDVGAGGELVFDTRRVKMGTNSQKYSMRHKYSHSKDMGTNSQKHSLKVAQILKSIL